MLHSVVVLRDFSEEDQQRIFQHSVRAVLAAAERLLPAPYLQLCQGEHPHAGLSEAAAQRLFVRLAGAVTETLALPYLDEHGGDLLVGARRRGGARRRS